jgi:hypothetical protein
VVLMKNVHLTGSLEKMHLPCFYEPFCDGFNAFLHAVWVEMSYFSDYVIALFASIALFIPSLRTSLENMATQYISMIYYFDIGARKLVIIGKFEELLEKISETKKSPAKNTEAIHYQKINVIAYSIGTVIALDALFPFDGKVSTRVRQNIDTLVTIACPFDFIRVYWPRYYESRINPRLDLKAWYNIYSTTDVLSSNFRNIFTKEEKQVFKELQQKIKAFQVVKSDEKLAEKSKLMEEYLQAYEQINEASIPIAIGSILPVNIPFNQKLPPQPLSTWEIIFLVGLKSHSMYWEEETYSASCLTNLMQRMY